MKTEVINPEKKIAVIKHPPLITVFKDEEVAPPVFPSAQEPAPIHCKMCNVFIHPSQLYVVDGWKPRPDGLNFLGAIPQNIYCIPCGSTEEFKKFLKKRDKAA
jgi:hypothetical protein